jgi:hypothetical protein
MFVPGSNHDVEMCLYCGSPPPAGHQVCLRSGVGGNDNRIFRGCYVVGSVGRWEVWLLDRCGLGYG